MKYNHIGICIGRKCTAACDMCCQSADMDCVEELDFEVVRKYIYSAKDLPYIESIGFSGGEAFLYFDKLIDYVECVKSIDKNATVTTNGFWASDEDQTMDKMIKLKEAGVSLIGISYDEFHAKHIPAKNIINILEQAKKLDIHIKIQSCMLNDSKIGSWIDNLGSHILGQSVWWFPCYPSGKAKANINDDRYIRTNSIKNQRCSTGHAYTVRYDGNIYPCCKILINDTELKIGSIYDENMDVAVTIKLLRNHNFLYILRNFGFDFYVEIAQTELSINLPEYVIDACELCSIFFCKENIHRFIPYVNKKIQTLKHLKTTGVH